MPWRSKGVATRALGSCAGERLIAVTDGGNGLEEALQRHLAEHLATVLDWYYAAEHLLDFAAVLVRAGRDGAFGLGPPGQGDPRRARGAKRC